MDTALREKLETASREIRCDVIRMTWLAGSIGAHIGGSLSLCEIMATLYCGVMRLDAADPLKSERDRLILSKGHGAIAMYAALKQVDYLTDDEIITYKQDGSYITAHPSLMPEKGMEFASGSLGQGLSIGLGVCLALKMKGNVDSRVFVIQGDGECDEGSVWEAAAAAAHYKANNLISVIDRNHLQYDGETKDILNMEDMADKWKSFGWDTVVVDGHNIDELYIALSEKSEKPRCIICDTIKGKGVSFIENDYRWHNSRFTESQYKQAMQEQGVEL